MLCTILVRPSRCLLFKSFSVVNHFLYLWFKMSQPGIPKPSSYFHPWACPVRTCLVNFFFIHFKSPSHTTSSKVSNGSTCPIFYGSPNYLVYTWTEMKGYRRH